MVVVVVNDDADRFLFFCFCFFRRHVTQEVVEINFGFEWNSGMFLEQETYLLDVQHTGGEMPVYLLYHTHVVYMYRQQT